MLVCQCNVITQDEVEAAILDLLDADPWRLIVPAQVHHALGKRGKCCGCFPNLVETIIRVTERFHARGEATEAVVLHLDRVRALKARFGRGWNEGRAGRHRAA